MFLSIKNFFKRFKIVHYIYWKINLLKFFFLKHELKFDFIYKKKLWLDNDSISGFNYKKNILYIDFLTKFIKEKKIKNIIDFGCGDFELFKNISLDDIEYTGVDIIKQLIDNNIKKFSNKKIKFIYGDVIKFNPPKTDLYFSRFVIQHLNNSQIIEFFKNKKNCKYFIVTIINPISYKYTNKDIKPGWWTRIDYLSNLNLSQKPFFIKNIKMIFEQKIKEDNRKTEVYFQTFLITNS